MGKGDRRSKVKKQRAGLGDDLALAAIPKRQPNGQKRQRADSPQDPQKTALGARCRMFGVADTMQNRYALSSQHSGCDLGRVMESACEPDEVKRLWSTWQGFCAACRTYRIRILGMTVTAKGVALAMMPEPMETDQSHSVDLRDPETRDRDATNAWIAWQGHLGHLPTRDRTLLQRCEKEESRDLWKDSGKGPAPTPAGLDTLKALRALADIVESRR